MITNRCIRCGALIYEDDRYDRDNYGDYICGECLEKEERQKMLELYRKETRIINLPEYALEYRWVVAREEDTTLWFWGAYDDRDRANNIAEDIGGVTVEVRL